MPDFYGSLEDAAAYHDARGNTAWAADDVTDAQRTAALVRASAALDGQYGRRYSGSKATRAQPLQWPRVGARDACVTPPEELPSDEVPQEVEHAAYALALLELTSPGASSPSFTPGAVMKREKAGEVERERFGPTDGVAINADTIRPVLATVEDHLRCVLAPRSGASVCLLRV